MLTLAEFNERTGEVRPLLAGCCAVARWADAVLAGRPYLTVGELLTASDAAVSMLARDDLLEALEGHPRIGEKPEQGGWSASEQAKVSEADAVLTRGLAEGNAAYEEKFGHIYLVCASGRSGAELLELLYGRLGNEPDDEWEVVAGELAKINRIRLGKLVPESW